MNTLKHYLRIDNIFEHKFIRVLVFIALIIILINVVISFMPKDYRRFFYFVDLDCESNIPTWFSSMLLAIASFFAYSCSLAKRLDLNEKRLWQIFSIGLICMSIDETSMVHENIGAVLNKYIFKIKGIENGSPWVVVLGPIALLVIMVFALKMRKYLKCSKKTKNTLLIGGLVYVFGAFVLESTTNINGIEWFLKYEYIFEEACEILGAILIIKALMEQSNVFFETIT